MRTTLETEARAIRKQLAALNIAIATLAVILDPDPSGKSGKTLDALTERVSEIDREADKENDRRIDGRDEFR